jgi:hypothetical protein
MPGGAKGIGGRAMGGIPTKNQLSDINFDVQRYTYWGASFPFRDQQAYRDQARQAAERHLYKIITTIEWTMTYRILFILIYNWRRPLDAQADDGLSS